MIVSAAWMDMVVSPVQLNGWPKATASPSQTNVVVPSPATVTSPIDMAAANESPARSPPDGGGGGGVVDADEPMYAMKGRPWRSIAVCICRRPLSVSPDADSGVFRRVIVAVCVTESPAAAAMRAARPFGTFRVVATDAPAPMSSSCSMSSAGVSPASVDPPPASPYAIAPARRSVPPERKKTGEPDAPAHSPPAAVTTDPERSTMMMSRPGPTASLRMPSTSAFMVESVRPRVTETAVPCIPVETPSSGRIGGHSPVGIARVAPVAGTAPHAATAIARAKRPVTARGQRRALISSLSLR